MVAAEHSHEEPLQRRPRLKRPEDWTPREGDTLIWVCGGEFYAMGVTLSRPFSSPGCHVVHCRRYGLFHASIDRLYPLRGWRERHAAEDAADECDRVWDEAEQSKKVDPT